MSSRRRFRRSADEWQALIAEQAGSGLSQTVFCQRNGIALSSFSKWKHKLGLEHAAQADTADQAPPWIDLAALPSAASGWDIELDLGGGVCLRLSRG
jgi:putative transposase